MWGPENGNVMLKDQQSDRFTFMTVDNGRYGEHPVYGNREFGFEKGEDGSTRFYTRAADRYDFINGQTPAGQTVASGFQEDVWNAWTQGVEEQITRQGGQIRPGSRTQSREMK